MPEAAATPIPRKGGAWVIIALALALFALGYALVEIATKKPGRALVQVSGIEESQEIFGGVPQEGDRLGSSDAPVTIQLFTDLQCGSCRQDFLGTIPTLVTEYARPGEVKFLMRHYSVAENPLERGSSAPRRPPSKVMDGSTPTSSSATRGRRNGLGSMKSSWPLWPPRSENSTYRNGINTWNRRAARAGRSRRLEADDGWARASASAPGRR